MYRHFNRSAKGLLFKVTEMTSILELMKKINSLQFQEKYKVLPEGFMRLVFRTFVLEFFLMLLSLKRALLR